MWFVYYIQYSNLLVTAFDTKTLKIKNIMKQSKYLFSNFSMDIKTGKIFDLNLFEIYLINWDDFFKFEL